MGKLTRLEQIIVDCLPFPEPDNCAIKHQKVIAQRVKLKRMLEAYYCSEPVNNVGPTQLKET